MITLAVLAHPYPGSFNHALFAAVCRRLAERGADVRAHDLYREAFNPVLTPAELSGAPTGDDLVRRHEEDLAAATLLVAVHPNWWGGPPAILKGWIDRVFRPPLAYDLDPADDGVPVPRGCLAGRRALVITTSNTDPERERTHFGDPLSRIWGPCVLGFCGFDGWIRRDFAVIERSDDAQRKAWLREAADLADQSLDAFRD